MFFWLLHGIYPKVICVVSNYIAILWLCFHGGDCILQMNKREFLNLEGNPVSMQHFKIGSIVTTNLRGN